MSRAVRIGPRDRSRAPRTGPPVFPIHAVAALFIERQHLARPRARRLTERNLVAFAEGAGGIQIDTINVLDRAHHLTLWSRFGPFDRAGFDRMAYRRRALFEYWAHAACFVSTTHLPMWRRAMCDFSTMHLGWGRWVRRNRKLMVEVEDAIRERGPLANADFERRSGKSGGWWSWKPATHALHCLWMTGRTHVHSRVHFQKRYDLAERIFTDGASAPVPDADAFARWHVERSLSAMGAATETDLRMYMTFPRPATARIRALKRMVGEGTVREIAVEGDRGRWFVREEDLAALAAAGRRRVPARGTTLLSPFDSFLWHRDRTARLFGFDYRIEVYTPGHKRRFGYYTMPIFHDGRIIGRFDAKNHREAKRLEVRAIHFEPWFVAGAPPPAADWGPVDHGAALDGLAGAIASLAAFLGAERTTLGRVVPARLAAPLRRALRAAVA